MTQPRTVVQLLDFVPNGRRSMDAFLLLLTQRLGERGWRTVFVFAGEPSEDFRRQLEGLNAEYLVQPLPGPVSAAVKLGRRLRSHHASVLQTHFISKFERNLLPLKLASGIPHLVVTDHSSGAPSPKSGVRLVLSRVRGRIAAAYVNHVIGVSEFVRKRDVEQVHFPAKQVSVVHNGVDVERYKPVPATPNASFTVAYAGQLIPQKGVSTLIEAVAILRHEGRAIRLDIAGVGAHEAQLRAQSRAANLDDVISFHGHIDWVHRLFSSADVVVVPSTWEEAFGFVVAEAAAAGGCLLVSDAGALPELVGGEPRAGLIFRRADAADLADKLRYLMDHPQERGRLRARARELAVQRFSLNAMVDGYVSYFERLA